MGFAAGPVSFQRFAISGPLPEDVTDEFIEKLATRAFGRVPPQADDSQLGWIGPRHLFETDLAAEPIAHGRFAHLALRIDRLKAPPNVVNAYVQMEEEALLAASGREFLAKHEKRQARVLAKERAEQEQKAGSFRRSNAYPVLIDLQEKTLFLGNTGAAVGEKLMALFGDTFGASLEPLDASQIAAQLMVAANNTRALDQLVPMHLVAPPHDRDDEAAGSNWRVGDYAFLGTELLTWLWYQTDAGRAPLELGDDDRITVMIDKTLRLKCDFGMTGTTAINADSPASLPEARAALRSGKQPTRMGLIVGSYLGELRFAFDAARWVVAGLQLPDDPTQDDPRAQREQRFELVADAANLLDALFGLFLQQRTSPTWPQAEAALEQWAIGKQGSGARSA